MGPVRRSGEAGFGFAQLLVIMPIVLIVMGSAASYFYDKLITNLQVRARENFQIHRQNILTDLDNPFVWEETLRVNSGLHCMEDSSCTSLAPQSFNVVAVDGKSLSGASSLGYELDGTPCATPPPGAPEKTCPIKWKFTWRPSCNELSSCPPDSEIEFVGELEENALIHSRLNLDRYKIVFYRRLF